MKLARSNGSTRVRIAAILASGTVFAVALVAVTLHYARKPISLKGAIVQEDSDTRKQSPITNVKVGVADHLASADAISDFSGFFRLTLHRGIKRGRSIVLQFRHPDFQPVDLPVTVGDKLYVVRMTPLHPETDDQPGRPQTVISNVFVRYSTETTASVNIGTGVTTFQAVNAGNVPCDHRSACSADNKWKAAVGSASLDAGQGNVFDDARVSCIAGPCPFTKIESDQFSHGGRNIAVSVLDWSDTTTFLFQAEVFRQEISDIVRESYPVIFGRALNFSLPAAAEGPSLEAEVAGTNIVFPLGPSPNLSWATCNVKVGKDQTKSYRCELKEGYRFP
ncbi:MAG TPA: hypothetical protein VNV41_20800 [Candidatus Acidoferrales bacterium]|jgi:hypothetical protein|nr:hypothetical protein [Candidatus Acidoferrales bacterium]